MSKGKSSTGITLRAVIFGLLLIPINAYWIIQMERVRAGPYPTSISFFFNVLFILFIIILINSLLRKYLPNFALSQRELLVLYIMLVIASALCGMDMLQALMQLIGYAFFFATPESRWQELFHKYIPKWLTVQDKELLTEYYQGHSSLYLPEHIRGWLVPVFMWLGFIVVLLFIMLCINVIVRKQWADRERLSFPVAQVPLAMTTESAPIFVNKWMWLGFGIAGAIDLINGFHFLFPFMPQLPVTIQYTPFNLQQYITTRPWNAIGWMPVSFYPCVIGLGFLFPLDLLFSCWFFFLFFKAQRIIANALAWDIVPNFPFVEQQIFGGCIALCLSLLWTERRYFKEVLKKVLGAPSELDDSEEALTYRQAAMGLVFGFALLVLFCKYTGMSFSMIILFFLIYFIISISVTRIRAELGPPVHDFHLMGPELMITTSLGTENIRAPDLTVFSILWWFNRAYRSHPMPHELEGLKIAQTTKMEGRRLVLAMVLATIAGTLASFWAFLHLGYQLGTASKFWAGTGYGWETWSRLQRWLEVPNKPNHLANLMTGSGFFFTIFLFLIRTKILQFPFHPIGFVISGSWSMHLTWMPIFIAWIIKLIVLKYWGLKGYRTAIPFFLGLILGESVIGSLWSVLGILLGIPTYNFWGA